MPTLSPLIRSVARRLSGANLLTPTPAFRSITIMLTEFCNLDCWMCDFASSKGLRESIAWSPADYIEFLQHPYFAKLHSIGFTGGEPFAYRGIAELYAALQERFPSTLISFSSNATLFKPMSATYSLTRDWQRTHLFTSIDGIATHDVQRGVPGAFAKSMRNLARLRERFDQLRIDVKFTITSVNHTELRAAYEHCTARGFNFTAKMVENNPHYTNVLSAATRDQEFRFTSAQLDSVRAQLEWILAHPTAGVTPNRVREMRELLASLNPAWRRTGSCLAPTQSAFLDSRMNFFCCKEYPPAINLNEKSLDELPQSAIYRDVIRHEIANEASCTRCTSQLKKARASFF